MNDPLTAGLSPSLRVSDTRGAITLSGNVESEAQKKKVESLARETPGVVSVANNLQVSGSAVAGLNPDRTLALTSRDQTGPATDMDTGGPLTPTSTRDLGDNMRGESDANQLSAGQTGPVTVNVQGS
ncbi:MAG TPA: BON domain-containing protein, partial [Candidatus Paceibacterota bacterium]|nr:BON domain-containing protein [Candidatus Paceibacterota bacterium]